MPLAVEAVLWTIATGLSLAAILLVKTWRRDLLAEGRIQRERLDALAAQLARLEAAAIKPSEPSPARPTTRRVDRPAAVPAPTFAPQPPLITVPDLSAPDGEASEAGADLGRRFGPIWDLAEGGASAESIAKTTGHPIGQIELILGLKRRSDGAPRTRAAGSERRP